MAEKKNTIEENFSRLDEIIAAMQSEEITLNEAFDLYKKGLEMVKDCNEQIEKIESEVKIVEEECANG